MSDRIKVLLQKRSSLKSQITNLTNLFENNKLDDTTLKLRIARLTILYHAFEDHNDELVLLDSNESVQDEFHNLQERFYNLSGKVENRFEPRDHFKYREQCVKQRQSSGTIGTVGFGQETTDQIA